MMYPNSRHFDLAHLSSLPQEEEQPKEYWENWFINYNRRISRMVAAHRATYWQQWSTDYSQQAQQRSTYYRTGVEA